MVRLTICSACQMGDHKRHRRTVQAVPEGMLGGSICTCQGECKDKRYEPKHLRGIADLMAAKQGGGTRMSEQTKESSP